MEEMKLTFVNVGYGEAIYLTCPDPAFPQGVFTMLIDGGSGEVAEYANSTTGRIPLVDYLKRQGMGHLDLMVNTHIHEDHLCGLLAVARATRPGEFWQTFAADFTPADFPQEGLETVSLRKFVCALNDCRLLRGELKKAGCRLRQRTGGEGWIPLCKGLSARILGPGAEKAAALTVLLEKAGQETDAAIRRVLLAKLDAVMNNYSMILQLEYHGVRILLPGDTNCMGYGGIEEDLRSQIFKVGHHGQRDGVSQALLERIAPTHVVCCASSDRRYDSAEPSALEMMRESGAALYFSDCPVAGVPPHQSLTLTVRGDGSILGKYSEASGEQAG